jgi:3-deoxy-D-manno-octulosonic-acid transferase
MATGRTIHVHGVSVGEVSAIAPLVRLLGDNFTGSTILLTTVTETGNEMALKRCPHAEIAYLPFDFGPLVGRFLDSVRPRALILAETELWPALFWEAAARNIPVIIVNGRISDRAWNRYRRVRGFFRKVLCHGSLFLVQDFVARDRFIELGARPDRVIPVGNIKFDSLPDPLDGNASSSLSTVMKGVKNSAAPVIALASTHPGEEIVLTVELLKRIPEAQLFIIPRHVERSGELAVNLKRETGCECVMRSDSAPVPGKIWILDTIGELTDLFQYVDLVIMGGSFVPVGGHNVLEPAAWGKPVIWGPHMENFREAEQLLKGRGGFSAGDAAQAAQQAVELLRKPESMKAMGNVAVKTVNSLRGATGKALAAIRWIVGAD